MKKKAYIIAGRKKKVYGKGMMYIKEEVIKTVNIGIELFVVVDATANISSSSCSLLPT